jgi:hypothetical protein
MSGCHPRGFLPREHFRSHCKTSFTLQRLPSNPLSNLRFSVVDSSVNESSQPRCHVALNYPLRPRWLGQSILDTTALNPLLIRCEYGLKGKKPWRRMQNFHAEFRARSALSNWPRSFSRLIPDVVRRDTRNDIHAKQEILLGSSGKEKARQGREDGVIYRDCMCYRVRTITLES